MTDHWSGQHHSYLSLTTHWWQLENLQSGTMPIPWKGRGPLPPGYKMALLHAQEMGVDHMAANITGMIQSSPRKWLGDRHITHDHLVTNASTEILPKILVYHNQIELIWRAGSKRERRWRLNVTLLLQEEVIQKCKNDLTEYINMNNSTEITSIWEASKAYIRESILAIAARKKKDSIKKITDKLKTLKQEHKTIGNKKKLKEMRQETNWIY